MISYDIYKRIKIALPQMDITDPSGWSNQPADDKIQVVSSSTSDVHKVTVWGTQITTGKIFSEEITLDGTTAVDSVRDDWDDLLGFFSGVKRGDYTIPVGNLTLREKTGGDTIQTISAGKISKGFLFLNLPGEIAEIIVDIGRLYHGKTYVTSLTGAPCADKEQLKTEQDLYLATDGYDAKITMKIYEQSA